jgi:hypothetical protein
MTRLALAPPWIAVLPFDLRYATPVLPIAIDRPGSSPTRSLPKQAFNAHRQQTASDKIPIASDAQPRHISRGFLPWRFAYAGPPVSVAPPSWGRHPQTFTIADSCVLANRDIIRSPRTDATGWVWTSPSAPRCSGGSSQNVETIWRSILGGHILSNEAALGS